MVLLFLLHQKKKIKLDKTRRIFLTATLYILLSNQLETATTTTSKKSSIFAAKETVEGIDKERDKIYESII